jgi:hypothetical protein
MRQARHRFKTGPGFFMEARQKACGRARTPPTFLQVFPAAWKNLSAGDIFNSPAINHHGWQDGPTRSCFASSGIRYHLLSNTVLMTENGGAVLTTQAPADLIIRNSFSIRLPGMRTLEER